MWQEYFKLIKIKPGRVDTALFGVIDFSDPRIPLQKIVALYESDFPYLAITPKGIDHVYGAVKPQKSIEETISLGMRGVDNVQSHSDTQPPGPIEKTFTKPLKHPRSRKLRK